VSNPISARNQVHQDDLLNLGSLTDAYIGYSVMRRLRHDVARQALAGVETGAFAVLADDTSRYVRGALSSDLTALYPALATTAPLVDW